MKNKELSKSCHEDDISRVQELKRDAASVFKVVRDPKNGAATNAAETKELFEVQMLKTFGTTDQSLALEMVQQIGAATPGLDQDNPETTINKLTPLLHGIGPKNEMEGMLAVQMVGIHNLSMEMMRRATTKNCSPEAINSVVNRVTKLSRTFIAQAECLKKLRSSGKQTIRIEKVEVGSGGQAVVGSVETGRGSGGE